MKQIVLKSKNCSGRGVRLREVSQEGRFQIFETASKEVGPDGTNGELRARVTKNSVVAMVAEMTEQTGFRSQKDLVAAGDKVTWKKLSAQDLDENISKYFSAPDYSALAQLFSELHDVKESEVQDILGEALDVTGD